MSSVFRAGVRTDREDPAFEDGTGHVIGHFVADQPVAGEAAVRPYVFAHDLGETLEKVLAGGGNVVGVWEQA